MNRTELDRTKPNQTGQNWIKLDQIESYWIEPNRIRTNQTKPNRNSQNWTIPHQIEPNRTESNITYLTSGGRIKRKKEEEGIVNKEVR